MATAARGLRRLILCTLASYAVGCGGHLAAQVAHADDGDSGGQNTAKDASPGSGVIIGPVDFRQAPEELPLECTGGIGHLAFRIPCKVGLDLSSGSQGPGIHETECLLAGTSALVWSFLLPLAQVAQQPSVPLRFPGDLPSPPAPNFVVELGGQSFTSSIIEGTLRFTQIDPPNRAFVARLDAKYQWTGNLGTSFVCSAGGLLWGAPGSFL
jgi:hypothetical protein